MLRSKYSEWKILLLGYIAIVPVIFHYLGCRNSDTFTIETKYEGSDQIYEIQVYRKSDSLAVGTWKKFFPNGVLMEESQFVEGKLHGVRKLYDEEGRLYIEENHQNGLSHGPYTVWHPNGQIRVKGQYEQNTMEGKWIYYYDTGQIKEIVHFSKNKENGPFVEYHPNGHLKAKGAYLDGDHEHGNLELYDTLGKLERILDCNKGICKTVWRKGE